MAAPHPKASKNPGPKATNTASDTVKLRTRCRYLLPRNASHASVLCHAMRNSKQGKREVSSSKTETERGSGGGHPANIMGLVLAFACRASRQQRLAYQCSATAVVVVRPYPRQCRRSTKQKSWGHLKELHTASPAAPAAPFLHQSGGGRSQHLPEYTSLSFAPLLH